ncbi:MAG: type II toxin-antitoxin system PemK/MazF family toxin [Solirubrobacteraceae bacterium]
MGASQRSRSSTQEPVVARGDVCWLEMADEGQHPVCVITRDAAIPALKNVVVVKLVTKTTRGIPSEVSLSRDDGMPEECTVSLDNLRTVPRALLVQRITTLAPHRMDELCAALAAAAGCHGPD